MRNSSFFEAVAVMIGTVIGAGIFGIPFVFAKAGFLTGFVTLIILSLTALAAHLMLSEVASRTKGIHQLTGYAERYLGRFGKTVMTIAMMLGLYGALSAYLIGVSESLAVLFGKGEPLWWGIGFFVFGAVLLFIGLSIIKRFELWMTAFVFIIVLVLVIASGPHLETSAFWHFSKVNIFLPYGVLLFALSGTVAIPEAAQVLRQKRQLLAKAVAVGVLAPAVIYAIFAFAVVGVTGAATTEVATIGLGQKLGTWVAIFGNLFAFFAMGTSFLTIGLALQDMYHYDYKLSHAASWMITLAAPLVLFISGAATFVGILGLSGGILGSIEGMLIVSMFVKARKMGDRAPAFKLSFPRCAVPVVFLVFAGGFIWTIWKIFTG